jgi:hypothetical protein
MTQDRISVTRKAIFGDHERRTNMMRVGRWATISRIGIFVIVGLITVEQGYAEDKGHACTLKTLKGRYLFALNSTLLPPAFGVAEPTPSSAAGFHVFNGDGTGMDIVTFRLGGVTVLENSVAPISYTVNSDCTGSYTVQNGGPSFGLFIAPDGESIAAISTAPPGNGGSDISPRVSH